MIGRLLTLLVGVALIAGIYFLSRGPGVSGTQTTAETPVEEPGYAARNASLVETGDDGQPLYTLLADRVRQHPNDNRVQLDAPRMTYVASDGNTWHIRARSGQIRNDGANVELYGEVHVNGQVPGNTAPAVIDTSVLSFDTKTEIVTTHAPVQIDWNGHKLSGTGMTAKLPDRQLTLESRIHGSFTPR